ncbi:MAG TPA: hypothetical protein VMN03_06715 [Burkholderiales bacterium]|jgi:5-methyltetrahydropteroyltriglutamate--homocysteine methyltransferase|nr:hypothetical protein [Burkholderiales bacterium]
MLLGDSPKRDFVEEIDAAVRQVVEAQLQAGIDIVNDGEQSRPGFSTYITERMRGFGGQSARRSATDFSRFPGFAEYWLWVYRGIPVHSNTQPKAVAAVEYFGKASAQAECERLLSLLRGRADVQGFMTAPSPGIISTTMQNDFYESHEAYLFALARELRKEYEVIAGSGLLLQIDAPDLAMERNIEFQEGTDADFLAIVEMHVAALNEALVNIPRDRVRLHCCWGASERPHFDDMSLELLLPVIRKARVGGLSIPFANPRHQHEYEVVKRVKLPADMKLIAGVIDNTTNFVEHPEVVSRRIIEAVSAVGDADRVIAGTDCGFGTFAGFQRVASDVTFAKLRACREGADLAAARL